MALTFIIFMLLISLAVAVFCWLHMRVAGFDYVGKCTDYGGLYDSYGPESIKTFANHDSKVIVLATAEDPKTLSSSIHSEGPPPLIKVTQILKSDDKVHAGDIIPICPGMGYMNLPEGEHPSILVFLEGKDGSTWVPTAGYYGIKVEDKNGLYRIGGINDKQKSYSLDELKKNQNVVLVLTRSAY